MLTSIHAELSKPFTGLHGIAVIRISVWSFGIARWPQQRANSAALIQAADRATDRCKHSDDAQAVMAASRPAANAG